MFHKIHILKCPGGEKGCAFTVESPRRDLKKAVERMVAHAKDVNHKLDLDKARRSFRIVEGLP